MNDASYVMITDSTILVTVVYIYIYIYIFNMTIIIQAINKIVVGVAHHVDML